MEGKGRTRRGESRVKFNCSTVCTASQKVSCGEKLLSWVWRALDHFWRSLRWLGGISWEKVELSHPQTRELRSDFLITVLQLSHAEVRKCWLAGEVCHRDVLVNPHRAESIPAGLMCPHFAAGERGALPFLSAVPVVFPWCLLPTFSHPQPRCLAVFIRSIAGDAGRHQIRRTTVGPNTSGSAIWRWLRRGSEIVTSTGRRQPEKLEYRGQTALMSAAWCWCGRMLTPVLDCAAAEFRSCWLLKRGQEDVVRMVWRRHQPNTRKGVCSQTDVLRFGGWGEGLVELQPLRKKMSSLTRPAGRGYIAS